MTKPKSKAIIFIRVVLWFGIIADLINTIQYIFPESMMQPLGMSAPVTPWMRFILIHAAALMAAWTLLLFWADRKPIERRGVLLLTIPIALGIAYSFCI